MRGTAEPSASRRSDLVLALGEQRAVGRPAAADLVQQRRLDLRRQHGLPAGHGADRLAHGLLAGELRQVAAGARGERLIDQRALHVRGQDQRRGGQPVAAQRVEHAQAVERGHAQVEHGDGGRELDDVAQRDAAVVGGTHQLELRPRTDRLREAVEEQRMVIGDVDRHPLLHTAGPPLTWTSAPVACTQDRGAVNASTRQIKGPGHLFSDRAHVRLRGMPRTNGRPGRPRRASCDQMTTTMRAAATGRRGAVGAVGALLVAELLVFGSVDGPGRPRPPRVRPAARRLAAGRRVCDGRRVRGAPPRADADRTPDLDGRRGRARPAGARVRALPQLRPHRAAAPLPIDRRRVLAADAGRARGRLRRLRAPALRAHRDEHRPGRPRRRARVCRPGRDAAGRHARGG